ncbi:MAG: hypothetical protein ACI82H_001898, partial [Alphaproteobacteria bacterium]
MSDNAQLIEKFCTIVGPSGLLTDANDVVPYYRDHRELFTGAGICVVR